ncbi:class I SAM-dependent methyltransferase [Ancylomarina salipaludis]|uniref:Class I SAM-dependent methyltransferase n=1 Tax=Ancylomarina salipaludis TaxID=2501299 RepID=A0A4Q1JL53_9BACT|nr:class I SAM-dependent methyltransferase [Ancylomarina salipaludis]RXQ94443.1 class I SAM-dependent methyltransferase [Ancylomarina salipaludis]
MENPWLKINHSDYENHMIEVGQSQILNSLKKYCLDKYQPKNFALLGCATGNGLEHVKSNVTNKVYAIDINQEYLNKTQEKFENQIINLELLKRDIQNEELAIKNIDLFFVGLVLEYVDPKKTLNKIIETIGKNGILFIVIQKNKQTTFVSKTKYKSLETLSDISNDVNENEIDSFICLKNMELIKKEEIELTKSKSFITLEYRKKE